MTRLSGVTAELLQQQGAFVWQNPPGLPFTPFRAFMYSQEELLKYDTDIYQHYMSVKGIKVSIAQAIHDHSMLHALLINNPSASLTHDRDALGDYLEGKTPVGIMGGHRLNRSSPEYRQIVLLARQLARTGSASVPPQLPL